MRAVFSLQAPLVFCVVVKENRDEDKPQGEEELEGEGDRGRAKCLLTLIQNVNCTKCW